MTFIDFKPDNGPNLLYKTRVYLVGHMQYEDGHEWREKVQGELNKLNIVVYNPYDKPFVKDVRESEPERQVMDGWMADGDHERVHNEMKEIRSYDLNLVDRSDFIIAHLNPKVASWGSAEEIFTANKMKKPIFVSIVGGKRNTPLWLMGTFPPQYIFDSVDDIISMIKEFDSGDRETDGGRWRLLRKELR